MSNCALRKLSPLEQVMVTIKDCSIDISTTGDWLGNPVWGETRAARDQLKINSDRLAAAYDKLRELTGAHPCR